MDQHAKMYFQLLDCIDGDDDGVKAENILLDEAKTR